MEEKEINKNSNETKNNDEIYCSSCGKAIKKEAFICPHCGVKNAKNSQVNEKNKFITALLAIFLGAFGVHKFYLGKPLAGIARIVILLVCITIGFGSMFYTMANITAELLSTTTTFDTNTNVNAIAELYNPFSFFNPLSLLVYVPGLLGFIEGIILLCMNDSKFNEKYNN